MLVGLSREYNSFLCPQRSLRECWLFCTCSGASLRSRAGTWYAVQGDCGGRICTHAHRASLPCQCTDQKKSAWKDWRVLYVVIAHYVVSFIVSGMRSPRRGGYGRRILGPAHSTRFQTLNNNQRGSCTATMVPIALILLVSGMSGPSSADGASFCSRSLPPFSHPFLRTVFLLVATSGRGVGGQWYQARDTIRKRESPAHHRSLGIPCWPDFALRLGHGCTLSPSRGALFLPLLGCACSPLCCWQSFSSCMLLVQLQCVLKPRRCRSHRFRRKL